MIDPTTRALLEFAVSSISRDNELKKDRNTNPRTREIEPGSVRREVLAANQWLEKVRRALKTDPPAPQDRIFAEPGGEASITVREVDCKVEVEFDTSTLNMKIDLQRAADFAAALIKYAKIAGRKTGRIVEVRL